MTRLHSRLLNERVYCGDVLHFSAYHMNDQHVSVECGMLVGCNNMMIGEALYTEIVIYMYLLWSGKKSFLAIMIQIHKTIFSTGHKIMED